MLNFRYIVYFCFTYFLNKVKGNLLNLIILTVVFQSFCQEDSSDLKHISIGEDGIIRVRVGLLFPNATSRLRSLMGFGQSAPAITIALNRAYSEGLVRNVNIT